MTDAWQWFDNKLVAFWETMVSCHGQHWWPCTVLWIVIATAVWSIAGALLFGDPTWPVRAMAWVWGKS